MKDYGKCPNCEGELKVQKVNDDYSAILKCKYCNKIFRVTFDERRFPSNINSFNWGAFGLWPIWGIWNKRPHLIICYLVLRLFSSSAMPTPMILLSGVVAVSFSFYYGFRGNKISWFEKEWPSVEVFEKKQLFWEIAGVVCFIISIFVFLFSLKS
ncbi:hypothetical protein [Phocaeicola sartorii]|uniref:DUF2628 domain-containing protein n=1 Tax=Phocaeicola sartorii TaxID=671267 RepID=R9ICG2_9BACT|nr:hypothetical protein [Phocaeicola sartorii]EOS15029.1 hypothetical protein C802_01046 [Phocaeicola sartorii]MCR1847559.1 hypothetical protein [Phocaeicola sartorii]NUL01186.1 hypothetical protein [Phocaeicola sartorii]